MLRCSRSTACTASASGLDPSPSSRMVSVIRGQLRPPSKGVPFSMAIAALGSKRWMSDLLVVDRPREACRNHGVGGDGEAVGDLYDAFPVDGVPDRPAHLHVVEGWLRHLRDQVPGPRERITEHLRLGLRIVAHPPEV